MLALPSLRAQTGLTGRDVVVGCVAESDPRSLDQALRLVQSIRWFGGELAIAQVVVCVVGGLDPSLRQAFEGYGAQVRLVQHNDSADKLQIFSEVCETDREVLLLDCDTVVVQDPLPWMQRGGAEAAADPDFQLDLSHVPPPAGHVAVDPAILRYHDRVDAEGYLLHSPYPFVQVRIEAFNRRLRQEREKRSGPRRIQERPAPSAGPAAQVVVLGMHRSGTSALTALLRLLGLWTGEEGDFPPADDHNQAGYWEHRGVWSIDEVILQTLGASWSEVTDLDLSRLDEGLRVRLTERARNIIRDLDRHGPWVVKDPRLCVLFPFWREILERPLCVLIHRGPLAVARSLAARDGFPLPYGIALWEQYTREALASTRGVPRVLVSHRELLADPEATLRRLHHQLARHRPELARLHVPTAEEIRAVLDPALVHHPYEPETERLYLTPPQLDLLDALADGSALELDPVPPLSPGARELLAAHQSLLATTRDLCDRLAAQAGKTASLQQAYEGLLAARQNLLATASDLRDRLAAQTESAASLQQAREELLAAHQNALATTRELRDRLAAQADALAAGAADLQRVLSWLDELDAIFSATLDSRSWKIGRAIAATLGRLAGPPQISAPERRDRLMAEVRTWRSDVKE